ncbi:hypothetical protein NUW54_g11700 [Trametes sanguinea]|uniref:Uncharacterized protein n=1 Tax=Trametes sanguinea TaxID=158606 RepID=A0ACC1N983_9APHY|nr:hypothetical protein NUW54_g11700 [Trametes sanguinea]
MVSDRRHGTGIEQFSAWSYVEKPRFFYIVGSRDEVGSKDKKSFSSVEPKDEGRVKDEVGSKDTASNGSRDEVVSKDKKLFSSVAWVDGFRL